MKEYILNTLKIGMTEKEAKKYFSKEIKKNEYYRKKNLFKK